MTRHRFEIVVDLDDTAHAATRPGDDPTGNLASPPDEWEAEDLLDAWARSIVEVEIVGYTAERT